MIEYFSFNFDGSVCNMFPVLTSGGCLHILSEGERKNTEKLVKAIENATAALIPTAVLEAFTDFELEQINASETEIIVAGEKLTRRAIPIKNLVNAYGPTETTVEATEYSVVETNRDTNRKAVI